MRSLENGVSEAHIRAYISTLDDNLRNDINNCFASMNNQDDSIFILAVKVVALTVNQATIKMAWLDQLRIWTLIEQDRVPEGYYVFVSTPSAKDGISLGEPHSNAQLNRAVALIRTCIGGSLLYRLAFDVKIELKSTNVTFASPIIRVPQPCEHPQRSLALWANLQELYTLLDGNTNTTRARMKLALDYIYSGTEHARFHDYWIGYEIAAGGKSSTIERRLLHVYPDYHRDPAIKSGFRRIARWRHNLVHFGQRVDLSAEVERLMQLLFLDIAAGMLGYASGGLARTFAQEVGLDLQKLAPLDRGHLHHRPQA